jgi:pyrroloquinoline quinone biosynthesis protein B
MSLIPHPRVVETVGLVIGNAPHLADRVRFIHLNHTNPALDPASPERGVVVTAGMAVADEGERHSL